MELTEKAAYLKGLIEGLGVDESTKEGRIIKAMSELLCELASSVREIDADMTQAYDQLNDISAELEDLEADLYEELEDDDSEDEDDELPMDTDDSNDPYYEVACPNCGETVYVSEGDLDAGEAICTSCGVTFEVALADDEADEDPEDAPVKYEVTCPNCGTAAVFEEAELLEGEPTCPQCGHPLDFEITEEK
ncbi:MAG: CD1247 N-terminal domain-containing protein [Faecalibacterium sp.]